MWEQARREKKLQGELHVLQKKHHIPIIAFTGSVAKEAVECNKNGIDAFFPILRNAVTLEDAIKPENAKANLADRTEQMLHLINAASATRADG